MCHGNVAQLGATDQTPFGEDAGMAIDGPEHSHSCGGLLGCGEADGRQCRVEPEAVDAALSPAARLDQGVHAMIPKNLFARALRETMRIA
jgi:hypothetical protein